MNALRVFATAAVFGFAICSANDSRLCETSNVDYEFRMATLEAIIQGLSQKLALSENRLVQLEAGQKVIDKVTKDCITRNSKSWSLYRVNVIFPLLEKIQFHKETPTITDRIPYIVPRDTRALLISIYCNFGNQKGHSSFHADIYQKDNEYAGIATVMSSHFNVYANTFYYEIMLPWNSDISSEVVFRLTSTFQTGGPQNWYQVKLVGYITD